MPEKLYIGIDVGKSGAIVGIKDNGVIYLKSKIPMIKTNVDIPAFIEILTSAQTHFDVFVAIEDVHSIFGSSSKSNFSFGEVKGLTIGIVAATEIPYTLVQPKIWQKAIWTPSDYVKKAKDKVDPKPTSLTAAKRIFPKESFIIGERSTKPHDGVVDAALISLYCKQYFK